MKNLDQYGKPLLRIVLSLVFLWFSISQFTAVDKWTGLVPEFIVNMGISAKTVILANATSELIFGVLLLFGIFTRLAAFILALHLFGIASNFGFSNPNGIRDFGLAFATLSVFLNGTDKLCLENKFKKKKQ
ncbi:MAG TPA: DoxX family protein [Candidatus Nanoarchaeia archaeon]|nr:DoxX family protein [Candidatus Nanoarchaeia archaeon]